MDSKEMQEAYNRSMEQLANQVTQAKAIAAEANRNSYELVREFMLKFGHPVYDKPQAIDDLEWEWMRLGLILEELCELYEACGYDPKQLREAVVPKIGGTDIVGAADALGDLEYVTNGMALGMGVNLPVVVREIHRSNMTKLGPDGKPIYREDGKILKGPGYEPPRIAEVLEV